MAMTQILLLYQAGYESKKLARNELLQRDVSLGEPCHMMDRSCLPFWCKFEVCRVVFADRKDNHDILPPNLWRNAWPAKPFKTDWMLRLGLMAITLDESGPA